MSDEGNNASMTLRKDDNARMTSRQGHGVVATSREDSNAAGAWAFRNDGPNAAETGAYGRYVTVEMVRGEISLTCFQSSMGKCHGVKVYARPHPNYRNGS